jgi:hypothetical protein
MRPTGLYGIMAEYATPDALVAGIGKAYAAGYRRMDAFTPYPIEAVNHVLGHKRSKLPWIVFAGGLIGALTGFGLQYYLSAIEYPLNIGGRPLNSWPSFIVITFELTILFSAFAAVFGMLALNGFPTPYHPVFNVPRFEHASRDRFFFCIEATDPKFDLVQTLQFMNSLGAAEVSEIAN